MPPPPPESAPLSRSALDLADLRWGRSGRALAPALTLRVAAGEALVVCGPNGAGKSTLLRTLAGLLSPVSGRAELLGWRDGAGEAERRIGRAAHYLGHRNALKTVRRVADELGFWSRNGGATPRDALRAVGLPDALDLTCGVLSAGQARRVALARLLVAPRPVWLLDEPSAGLDAAATDRLAAICRTHLSGGGILVAATHLPLGLGDARRLDLAESTPTPEPASADPWSEW